MIKDAQWAEDKEATECRQCAKQFSVSRRRVSIALESFYFHCRLLFVMIACQVAIVELFSGSNSLSLFINTELL